ncbi:MAG: tetratricopeptide repeat protein [Flavobacteriales bacterium]|nr:tetratricopeptide repeat protein [Flavobacteriales bacterium]
MISTVYPLAAQKKVSKLSNLTIKEKATRASEKAWSLRNVNPDSSLYFATEALNYARDCSDQKIEAYSLSDIGNYYKRKEEYSKALHHYIKSLEIRKKINNKQLVGGAYNQIGLLYHQQEKYDSAIFNFENGIHYLDTSKNSNNERLKLLSGYSMSLYRSGNYKKALAYIDTAFALSEKIQDSLLTAIILQNKGNIHQDLGQNALALNLYNKAQFYYEQIDDVNGLIDLQINMASLYILEGNYSKAEKMLKDASNKSSEVGLDNNLSTIYFDLAELYSDTDKRKAIIYYKKAYDNAYTFGKSILGIESGIELAHSMLKLNQLEAVFELIQKLEIDLNNESNLSLLIDFHQLKSSYYHQLGDYKKAYKFNKISLSTKDSLYESINNVRELSALLEVSRQEKKAALEKYKRKEAENNSYMLEDKMDQMLIRGLIALVIILILGIWLLIKNYRNKTKASQIELEKIQQEQLFKNQISQMTYEADMKFFEDRLKIDDEIRKSIGKDLHDQLASKLAVIQINLDSLTEQEKNEEKQSEMNKLIDLVEESCGDVRTIAHNLIGHDRLRESLADSIEKHCQFINNSGKIHIDFHRIGEPYDVNLEVKKNLLSTIILLIDNIVRHAKAKDVSIELFYHDDSINIALNDDGVGFDMEKDSSNKGVGLINAQERIKQINGEIEIYSRIKHGTTVSISIPIYNER